MLAAAAEGSDNLAAASCCSMEAPVCRLVLLAAAQTACCSHPWSLPNSYVLGLCRGLTLPAPDP